MVKEFIINLLAALVLVARNFFRLIFYPYKTMRKIVIEKKDCYQILIIFLLVYLYFVFANMVRRRTLHPFIISTSSLKTFIFFLATFLTVSAFFYLIGRPYNSKVKYADILFAFAYSLFPTLIWFFTTSTLYFILPPPRTFSFLGQSFSLVFITFSLVMFFWKIILFYLALRFSLRASFYKIVYLSSLFLAWFMPYSILMYKLKVFRVPFI